MPIDPRIALGVQPLQLPMQNPNAQMNMLAQAMQLKSGMSQMQAAEQERAERNALNEAYRGALGSDGSVDRNALFRTLADRNLGAKIPGLQKQFADADRAKYDVQKAAGEGYKLFQQTLGSQFNNPNLSRQSVLQSVTGLVESGAFDRNVATRLVQTLPEDPQQLREHLRSVLSSQMTPEQMLTAFAPKPEKMDNGQQISFRDTNPNSPTYGQVTAGGVVQKVASPESVLSAQTQIRGQDLVDERARERLQFDQGNAVTEAGGPTQALMSKRFGKPAPGYRWKEDGSQEAIPGGPADIKSGEAGAKRERQQQASIAQADRVIAKVDEALGKVGWTSAGPASVLSKVPGSPARNLQATLDTIKANLGFAELQQMREASPTGGALGAIAVQELVALQSTVASLDQAQTPGELEKSLGQVKKHYENWRNAVRQANQGGGAAPAPAGGKTMSMADVEATARASGRSVDEVKKAAQAKGYTVR